MLQSAGEVQLQSVHTDFGCSCVYFFIQIQYGFLLDRIVLVESIPLGMDYETNVTFGVPIYKAWKDLLSTATEQIDIASFYWSLTGEDIGVKSPTDQFVSNDSAASPQSQNLVIYYSLSKYRNYEADALIM